MGFVIKRATRRKAKMRIGLFGASGSGKTMSALKMARGLTTAWNKIVVIDTEHGSADLYDNLGDYHTLTLNAPFSPERYIEAINDCVKAGFEVIIIDSISHEWEGPGGCLELVGNMPGNSYTNWNKITPRHRNLIYAILSVKAHVICTARAKAHFIVQETTNSQGRSVQAPKNVGTKPVTRDGFEYDVMVCFDLDNIHQANCSKDRTGRFAGRPEFIIDEKTGEELLAWIATAADALPENEPSVADARQNVTKTMKKLGLGQSEFIAITGYNTIKNLSLEDCANAINVLTENKILVDLEDFNNV